MTNFNVTPEISAKLKQFDFRPYLIAEYGVRFDGPNCCCPHPDHDDHHPSFSVGRDKTGIYCWCCHSCHVGRKDLSSLHKNYGNDFIALLRWLSDYSGSEHVLTFQEAALKACGIAGIEAVTTRYDAAKERKLAIKQSVAKGCAAVLLESKDSDAYQYLVSRNLCEEDMKQWMLGYNGERIVFPLMDKSGRVIAFSNRVIGTGSGEAKYINSPNSEIFTKGEYLYGIHRLDTSLDYVYVTEGQMDVIAAYKYGLKNVLASLGTAFTESHINTLKRYEKIRNIIFIFDGDDAGRKALNRSAVLARNMGFAVSYVLLPESFDLYDYSMMHKEKLPEEIRRRTSYYFYKELEGFAEEFDKIVFSMRSQVLAESNKIYMHLADEKEKGMFRYYLNSKFGIDIGGTQAC